jgi:DNA-directed RNA polymerase subunit alpha
VVLDPETQNGTYGKFSIEPFERGYGITIGNSLRRVLLSSIEGASAVSMRLAGAAHEFASIPGVVEDVINIALNVKAILVKYEGEGVEILKIEKSGAGPVTAGDLVTGPGVEVVNKDLVIATLADNKVVFKAEIEFRKGRGYIRSEDFAWKTEDAVGTIYLDAAFSPVRRARWRVEETRVGKVTDYDRLVLEIWTNGTITPEFALVEASTILRKHLNPFVRYYELGRELERDAAPDEEVVEEVATIDNELAEKLSQPVSVLDPSVRAANCLSAEGIKTLGDLVGRCEPEMLQVRNFGKTSLKEIKLKLAEIGLSFGMNIKG